MKLLAAALILLSSQSAKPLTQEEECAKMWHKCSQAVVHWEFQRIEKDLRKYGQWPWFYSQGQTERVVSPGQDPALNWYKGVTEMKKGTYKRYKN